MPIDLQGIRQSDRVSFRMPVEASWLSADGAPVTLTAETMLVSRNGGVLRLIERIPAGRDLQLRRHQDGGHWKTAHARVVAEIDQSPEGFLYAIHLLDPHPDFWGIDFPHPQKARDAVARLLMECSFCQRREVVHLNELQLKSFEIRKCVARLCLHCDSPSIWIEAPSEIRAEESGSPLFPAEERLNPRRNRTRIKARVLACIRRRGFQEEIAVCEDLSQGGLSFRSRNQYEEGSRVEVAVPFAPGAGAIFVPIRIISSEAIPSAGLFLHRAAYVRLPLDA